MIMVLAGFSGLNCFAAGKASHVVLVVWDGMRADFVSEETTPTLSALAKQGVLFLHHHSVYPSMTEVNATAISTGVYPRQSTMLANNEYRLGYEPLGPIETDSITNARKGDVMTSGHYLAFPTIAELVQSNSMRSVVAGTKPVALLHDRAARGSDAASVDVYAGHSLPEDVAKTLTRKLGKFPKPTNNKIPLDRWTTKALTTILWEQEVPAFSLLWLAEPDFSQHHTGPGSKTSLAAIKSSDDNLRRVLDTLDKKNLRDSTDIIIASDHGFSTILENIDISTNLRAAGFSACTNFPASGPKDGDVLVVGNGGEISCYVMGHDTGLVAKVVHFLQTQPFAGVIFCRQKVEGTFPLSDAGLDTPDAPDILIAVHWKPDHSQYGAPGFIYDDGGALQPGEGQHASLDPFDMHNICVAAGPDFVEGMQDPLPSGNMDIAPTIHWILGIEPEKKVSGRVLSEALNFPAPTIKSFAPHHWEAEWKGDGVVWKQYLNYSTVNDEIYLDEGNGAPASP